MSRSSRSRSRPRMSASERREQLLDVALEIICDQGSAALSIDAIAKGAGITRPVVYTQFGDLAGLLNALVEREEHQVLQQLAKAIPMSVGQVEPDDVIINAIETFLTAVRERPRTWQIVLTPPQGMPRTLHDRVVERREAVIEQITPLIAWGVTRRGGPVGVDHRLLARIILVLAEEAGRLVISQPDSYSPEVLVQQARVLVAALATDGVPQPGHGVADAFEAELAQAHAAQAASAAGGPGSGMIPTKAKAPAKPSAKVPAKASAKATEAKSSVKADAKPATKPRSRSKKPPSEAPAT